MKRRISKIETIYSYGKCRITTRPDGSGKQDITLQDLHDPLETRDTLDMLIAMVSNEIHTMVTYLTEPTDELVITIERRVSPDREVGMSDEVGVSAEEEDDLVPVI